MTIPITLAVAVARTRRYRTRVWSQEVPPYSPSGLAVQEDHSMLATQAVTLFLTLLLGHQQLAPQARCPCAHRVDKVVYLVAGREALQHQASATFRTMEAQE